MTEFEIHQLIVGSRYEFDFATVVYMGWSVAFIFLSRMDDRSWSPKTLRIATWLYLAGASFIVVRCVASMLRGIKQTGLLAQTTQQFDFANPLLQVPTLGFRIAIYVMATVAALHFIRSKRAD